MCQSICLVPAFDFKKQIFQNSCIIQAKPSSVSQWGCWLRIAGAVNFWLFSNIAKFFSSSDLSLIYFTHMTWWGKSGASGCNWQSRMRNSLYDCELSECNCDGFGRRRWSNRGVLGLVVCEMKLGLIQTDRDRAVWASACPSPLLSGCFLARRNRRSLRLQCFLTVRKILL